MSEDKILIDALATSLKMEEEGYKFYIGAKEKSVDKYGKNIFQALAEDEKRHIDAIRKYSNSFIKSKKTPALTTVMPEHQSINKRVIFGKSSKEMLKDISSNTDQIKAYEIGMKMETDGYNFYKKAEQSVKDINARELYKFLMSEEKLHYKLIADTYEYIKNPEEVFLRSEKPIIEG